MTNVGLSSTSMDLIRISKYAVGATTAQYGEKLSDVGTGTAGMAAISGTIWTGGRIINGAKNWRLEKAGKCATKKGFSGNIGSSFKEGFKALHTQGAANSAILKNTMSQASGKGLWESTKAFFKSGSEIVSKGKLEQIVAKGGQSAEAAKAALETGKNFTQSLKSIQGSGIGKSLLKGVKGNALFAGISLGLGIFSDVIPAWKTLGPEKGLKQLGKTAINTVGEVGGWAIGSAVGSSVGASVGAAIGTAICPGVGTVVGGLIGIGCSFLGAFLGGKAAKAITGKSEMEKAKEQSALEISKQAIAGSDEEKSQIAQAAYNRLIQTAVDNGGKLSEEDHQTKQALERLTGEKIDIEATLAQLQQQEAAEAQLQEVPQEYLAQQQLEQQVTQQGADATAQAQTQTQVQTPAPAASRPQVTGLPNPITYSPTMSTTSLPSSYNPFQSTYTGSIYDQYQSDEDKDKKAKYTYSA